MTQQIKDSNRLKTAGRDLQGDTTNYYTGPERRESGIHSSRRHDEHAAVLKQLDALSANHPRFYMILAGMLTINLLILAVNISTYKHIGDTRLMVIDTVKTSFHESDLNAQLAGQERMEKIEDFYKSQTHDMEDRLKVFIEMNIKETIYSISDDHIKAIKALEGDLADIKDVVGNLKSYHPRDENYQLHDES